MEQLTAAWTATLQHFEAVAARQQHLLEVRIEAEEQLLHRAGMEYSSGQLTFDELFFLYRRYKALGLPLSGKRWNTYISIPWKSVETELRRQPNGPEGSWIGTYPLGSYEISSAPGVCVVYVLFDAANEPVYVGSTQNLRERLKAHLRDGKSAARWQAHRCEDREAAYALEEKLQREHLPKLNRRIGR